MLKELFFSADNFCTSKSIYLCDNSVRKSLLFANERSVSWLATLNEEIVIQTISLNNIPAHLQITGISVRSLSIPTIHHILYALCSPNIPNTERRCHIFVFQINNVIDQNLAPHVLFIQDLPICYRPIEFGITMHQQELFSIVTGFDYQTNKFSLHTYEVDGISGKLDRSDKRQELQEEWSLRLVNVDQQSTPLRFLMECWDGGTQGVIGYTDGSIRWSRKSNSPSEDICHWYITEGVVTCLSFYKYHKIINQSNNASHCSRYIISGLTNGSILLIDMENPELSNSWSDTKSHGAVQAVAVGDLTLSGINSVAIGYFDGTIVFISIERIEGVGLRLQESPVWVVKVPYVPLGLHIGFCLGWGGIDALSPSVVDVSVRVPVEMLTVLTAHSIQVFAVKDGNSGALGDATASVLQSKADLVVSLLSKLRSLEQIVSEAQQTKVTPVTASRIALRSTSSKTVFVRDDQRVSEEEENHTNLTTTTHPKDGEIVQAMLDEILLAIQNRLSLKS